MPKNAHPPRSGPKKTSTAAAASSSKDEPKSDTKAKGKGKADVKGEGRKPTVGKPGTKSAIAAKQPDQDTPDEPPKKLDTRALIGGASWTGKLPLTMFAELCQKQKWNKPEYTMVREVQNKTTSSAWLTIELTYRPD